MPRGDKSSYPDRQQRKAEHIEQGCEARGLPEAEAERRAWATVNQALSMMATAVDQASSQASPSAA